MRFRGIEKELVVSLDTRKGGAINTLFFNITRYKFGMLETFCEIFEYLMQRVNNSPMYQVKRTVKNLKAIERFLTVTKIEDTDELWNYLLFQLVLSENRRSNRYSITLLRMISLNAIKRWNSRSKEEMFLVSRFQRERKLRNPLKKKDFDLNQKYLDYQRKKFFNTPRGFILCGEYEGLLYHSIKCNGCQYKKACEKAINQ